MLLITLVAPFLRQQLIVGTLVNAALFLAVLLVGFRKALFLGFLPSSIALISGILPWVFFPVIPFIILANAVLILVFAAFVKSNYWVAVVIASFLKFVFLYGCIFFCFSPAIAIAGYLQLCTAILGGLLAFSINLMTKKNMDHSN